jgi:hypothetical protein
MKNTVDVQAFLRSGGGTYVALLSNPPPHHVVGFVTLFTVPVSS